MGRKFFRMTVEGAALLDGPEGWLKRPRPVVPQVIVPQYPEWIMGADEFFKNVPRPAIVLINIGSTALPEGLQREIVDASKEALIVWVHIRTQDNKEIHQAFLRQISESKMDQYIRDIPGLAKAIEASV